MGPSPFSRSLLKFQKLKPSNYLSLMGNFNDKICKAFSTFINFLVGDWKASVQVCSAAVLDEAMLLWRWLWKRVKYFIMTLSLFDRFQFSNLLFAPGRSGMKRILRCFFSAWILWNWILKERCQISHILFFYFLCPSLCSVMNI